MFSTHVATYPARAPGLFFVHTSPRSRCSASRTTPHTHHLGHYRNLRGPIVIIFTPDFFRFVVHYANERKNLSRRQGKRI